MMPGVLSSLVYSVLGSVLMPEEEARNHWLSMCLYSIHHELLIMDIDIGNVVFMNELIHNRVIKVPSLLVTSFYPVA